MGLFVTISQYKLINLIKTTEGQRSRSSISSDLCVNLKVFECTTCLKWFSSFICHCFWAILIKMLKFFTKMTFLRSHSNHPSNHFLQTFSYKLFPGNSDSLHRLPQYNWLRIWKYEIMSFKMLITCLLEYIENSII